MANIQEVAKKAGVSTATVSRAFSAPDLINAHTQERVLEAARQLDYRPPRKRAADSGFSKKAAANAIGFQFFAASSSDTLLTNAFYAPILAGAQAEASALGLHLLLHSTDRRSLSIEAPKMALERAVGGMLLVGTADPFILAAFARHVPHIVLVDNKDETGAYESVISDGFGGAFAATRHLLELGHRRIGYFLCEPGVSNFQDRLRGYCCALWEAGIAPDPHRIVADISTEQSARRLTHLLTSSDAPTALITANDQCAHFAMRVCRSVGRQVPDDISLIGFDDISSSAHADVSLTTVRVDKEFMGRLAVRRLHARMNANGNTNESTNENTLGNIPETANCVCNQVPVSLVARQSCLPCADTFCAVMRR